MARRLAPGSAVGSRLGCWFDSFAVGAARQTHDEAMWFTRRRTDAASTGLPSQTALSKRRLRMGDYKKLEVWKFSCQLALDVERFLDHLPERTRIRHADQLCRAVNSIHENSAEGCGLNSDRQLLKYARQALGSGNETEDELLAMQRRGHLKEAHLFLLTDARRVCAMLAGLIRRIDSSSLPPSRKPKPEA
jgi:four helix bundle protein